MQATTHGLDLQPSSKARPCPICGRTKDGDCRIRPDGELVICHYGSSHHPPDGLKPGEVIRGNDGQDWAFTGETSDGRGATFTPDKPREGASRVVPLRRPALIELARLPEAKRQPPDHLPDGHACTYSPTQLVKVLRKQGQKADHIPHHMVGTAWRKGAGPDPWPVWCQADAITHGAGQWISEAEGEKCAQWLRAGGLVAISQPGHALKTEAIEARYRRLQQAGIVGIAYLADNDDTGQQKAQKCSAAAAAAGLQFRAIQAAAIWPGLPVGGSIDDAPGPAAERVATFLAAAQQPPQAAAASPPADAPAPAPEAPAAAAQTPEAKLARLGEIAADVLARRVEFAQRLPILRHHAMDLGLTVRDPELLGLLTAARRQRLGTTGLLRPGDRIDMTPEPWAWQGLILRGCLNLLVALPKVGKSSLLLALISAWHYGAETFLGQPLYGPCPPVLLIGTDQGQADWGRMLHAAGLVDDAGRILPPIIGLAHAGQPVHLDAAGIDTIAEAAQQNPGLLVVVDSIQATCTAPLGLKEESPEIAMPLADLMEQVEPHGATVVAIHHASKGRAGDGPAAASRGSTALPALASQLLKLAPASEAKEDHRRLLTAEGRGGAPVALVIEKNDSGWTYCGGIEDLNRERDQEATRRKLNDRQADVLDLVGERWRDDFAKTTARDVVAGLGLSGKDPETSALRNLKQLERKGLLQSSRKADQWGGRGAMEFWPTADSLARAHAGAPENVSPVSEVSPVGEGTSRVRTRIDSENATSDTSDTSDSVFQAPARGVGSVSEVVSPVQEAPDRVACLVDGEPGWTRRAAPMGRSVVVIHADGRQLTAGREQIADA